MPTDTPMEEDVIENELDRECQQIAAKHSVCEFLNPSVSETLESESDCAVADKNFKFSNQRSSNRLTKRPRKDDSSDIFKKSADIKQDSSSIRSKTRRPWELWSVEDKNAFFEALCEYGKDFESIQSYIAQRSKKKGTSTNMIKNKDQVRHFYYRTWHKISKFLQINECVQKQTQELYGLINYAELRKKIGGCLNEKNRLKLNELVFNGVTTVKCKGKKLRIKTPVCRALKKLNNFTDSREPDTEKLPKDIFVEFRPYTNTAWLHVQNLAQNPRVRTKVCLQKRLKPVIEYLQRRWSPYRLKRREQILNSLPSYNSDKLCDLKPILRVRPPRGVKIFPLSMSAIDTASSSDVCLEKYLKLSFKSICKDISKTKRLVGVKLKSPTDKMDGDEEVIFGKADNALDCAFESNENQFDIVDVSLKGNKTVDESSYINLLTPPKSVPEPDLPTEQNSPEVQRMLPFMKDSFIQVGFSGSHEVDCGPPLIYDIDPKPSNALNIIQPNTVHSNINKEYNVSNSKYEDRSAVISFSSTVKEISSELFSEKDNSPGEKQEFCRTSHFSENLDSIYCRTIYHGWTVEEAGFLTFGELYLLFGKPATIVLEYDFEYLEADLKIAEIEIEKLDLKTAELSPLLNKVVDIAQSFFLDKHKQQSGKQPGRSTSKSKLKVCSLNEKGSKEFSSSETNGHAEFNLASKDVGNSENFIANTPNSTDSSSPPTSDKHVFIMPVGTAPRNIKHPDQNSLKKEIGKLIPSTRRGCRVRRKPLVVQRPLLPREGMRPISGPRPMTLVHFVPSVPSLTTTIPPGPPRVKSTISSAKNVVNILPPGIPLDMHPVQVPVVKQLNSESGQSIILQRNSIPSSHVLVEPSSAETLQVISNSVTNVSIPLCESAVQVKKGSIQNQNNSTEALNLDLLAEQPKSVNESKENYMSLSQMSLPDTTGSLESSESPSTSFLDEFGLVSKTSAYDTSNLSSCLTADIPPKECTSSEHPSHHSFRINSSEIQWFNGESTELSLNTFLNSIDTPSKMPSTSNMVTENSNLDPISRLAPVVDSQVRCLLDECSIDFITKFEDLADVINSSSSSDSKQT